MSNLVLAEVKTGLDLIKDISDSAVLSDLMEQWDKIKPIGAALEKKVKGVISEHDECGDYFFKQQSGGRSFSDTAKAEEIAGKVLSTKEIESCKSLSVTSMEKIYIDKLVEKHGCPKKEAKDLFNKTFGVTISVQNRNVLSRKAPSLEEAVEKASKPEF